MNYTASWPHAFATVAVGAGLIAATVACVAPNRTVSNANGTPSAWNEASTPAPKTPMAAPPVAADFTVDVIVTEQKCFGSAGCNYRYTINPQYIGTNTLPDKTTVIFTVSGGDQDQVDNFTIDEDGLATFDRETSLSGPAGANLRATVTRVIPGR